MLFYCLFVGYLDLRPLLTSNNNVTIKPTQTNANMPIIMVPFVQETKGKLSPNISFYFQVKLESIWLVKYDIYQLSLIHI